MNSIWQAKDGSFDILNKLIKNRSDVNEKNKDGNNMLIWSAYSGFINFIPILIEAGANIHSKNNDGLNALMLATYHNNFSIVSMLLSAGSNINDTDKDKETALMLAARWNGIECVTILLEAGVDIHMKNKDGYNALMLSLCKKNMKIFSMLVDKKINIDETNKDGDTAMMLAVRLENIEAVEILIKNKASIKNKNKNHETVMDVAKSNFYIKNILDIYIKEINKKEELIERFIFEIKESKFFKSNETKIPNLKKMIAEGVDINSVNKYKNYPIITAIDSNNFEIIKFLLENGADVNVQNTAGETAITRSLLQAHMSGCYDSEAYKIVEFLLKNGANPNFLPKVVEISQNTNTPLIQAVSYKNRYLVKLLIQYGADVNQESADDLIAKWTTTPLITSIGDFKMFRYLVKKGAKINKINRNGDNPLIYAAINCKTKYLSLLINSGESCSVKNKELSTPIMESLRHSDPDYRDFYKTAKQWRFYRYQTITKLVRHGCDINAKNIYGNSALNIACYHGFLDIIEFLIKQGSKVNLQDNNGNTPLHSAVLSSNDCSIESKFKYIKIIYILYKYGADTHIKNNENKIPINLVNKNNIEILNILLRITKKEESGFLKFKFF